MSERKMQNIEASVCTRKFDCIFFCFTCENLFSFGVSKLIYRVWVF